MLWNGNSAFDLPKCSRGAAWRQQDDYSKVLVTQHVPAFKLKLIGAMRYYFQLASIFKI